jgi:chromatin modification-related protein EAF6
MSASFRDSGNATPTGGPNGKNAGKNKKKEAAAATTEDSENDWQGNKKRTNFGASRK